MSTVIELFLKIKKRKKLLEEVTEQALSWAFRKLPEHQNKTKRNQTKP